MSKALSTMTMAVAVALGAGCVDAKKAFDEYGQRIPDAQVVPDAPPGSCTDAPPVPDITGEFFMVAHHEGLPKDFSFLITFTFHRGTDGAGTVDVSAQPLKAANLMPTGDPLTAAA